MNSIKNTKGFTLVELLAVIVILAIVAVVTTPAIANVISNSRKEGAKDKAWGTIDAVRVAYTQAQAAGYIESDTSGNVGITYSSPNLTVTFSGTTTPNFGGKKAVSVSGDKATAGTIRMNLNSGVITAYGLTFEAGGKYTCSTNTEGTDMCCKQGASAPTSTDTSSGKDCEGFKGTMRTNSN